MLTFKQFITEGRGDSKGWVNLKTKKVKEHIYKRQHAAEAKVVEYMTKQTHEFVVCSHDTIHYVHPDLFDDDDD